jgi:hypothetical protein
LVSCKSLKSPGSFQDLDRLLQELGKPAIIELGKPAPAEKHLPRKAVAARCPAAHNELLVSGEDEV